MGDVDVAATDLRLSPAPGIRVMRGHNAIHRLHQLVRRHRPPRPHGLRNLSVDGSQHIRIHREQSAGHDHPDSPKINGTGREDRSHPRQSLPQTNRVVHQPAGRTCGQALGCRYLGGDRLPRVDAPQLAALAVLHRNLASLVQLGDGRQSPRACRVLLPRGIADYRHQLGVIAFFEHVFDTRSWL